MYELHRVFQAGVPLAPIAALYKCNKNKRSAPHWVVSAAASALCALLSGEKSGRRGRSSGIIDRARQDYVDYFRFDKVREVHEKRKWLKSEISVLRELTGKKARERLAELEALYRAAGTDPFQCASKLLVGTAAFGGRDAIKKSYRRVESHKYVWDRGLRYYFFDPQFLRKVGIDVDSFRQGKELTELLGLEE